MYRRMDPNSIIEDLRYQSLVAKVAQKIGIKLSIQCAVRFGMAD